jgi:hypothetical protein
MKTVICFDTDDLRGMNDARKIMEYLCKEYLERPPSYARSDVKFGKIDFIKMLRRYGRLVEEGKCSSGLRDAKLFADEEFETQKNKRYKT